ncbi:Palmitoyltransferase ZDHHC6 [Nymphon striatum]|nr:Palmitoyltransferase ZDHHC6 [Nymphon striatum]
MGTRVLHWGPLFALFIIIFISITSINVILIWWPPLMSWGAFLHMLVYMTWYYYYGNGNDPIIFFNLFELFTVVFSIGLSLGVAIAVGALLYFQVKSAMKNETGIETWIITKAISRRSTDDEDFIYPYDLGSYWKNFSQVLSFQNGCRPLVQGITDWPLQESTHKYTFTIEQKQQKLNKRQRVVQYEIVEAYSGYWFPCSKGYKICCHPPISDEPRIMLVIGDKVLVSRWKRHRGWFPRRCAVEVIGDSPTLERKKEL